MIFFFTLWFQSRRKVIAAGERSIGFLPGPVSVSGPGPPLLPCRDHSLQRTEPNLPRIPLAEHMIGFELVPVQGGDPIHLPPGETVLGRGPFLGVSDKRVSRHHALLENLKGQLRLKPTHLNPCFLQSSPTYEPRPLQRDSWCPLRHGDLFSLLPGQFIFRVVAVGGDDYGTRNSRMFVEETDERPVSSKPYEGPAALLNEEEVNSPITSLTMGGSTLPMEVGDDHSDGGVPVSRKRVLPAWMMSSVPKRPSPSLMGIYRAELMLQTWPSKTFSITRAAAKPATELDEAEAVEAEAEAEAEARPSKRMRKISDEGAHGPLEGPVRKQNGPSDEAHRVTMEVEEEAERNTSQEDRKLKSQTTKQKPAESVGFNSDSASASTQSQTRVRTPCPYGKDCYRKNPIHFQECCHPGDIDYEEGEEEGDRPECPYGTACYRKNPLHRKEYKHTKRAARTTRNVIKRVDEDDDDEDDSEDVGNDSDYIPPDSDNSDEDDVRRLQEAATEFLKRRK
ncbi:aprataxin and PNK-like factor [Betta splendens]|uniref:Aprataxin and PNK-like factor n=1 Tax=Betta splendens TaxID=158456 RepID=A0A8M1H6P5_BETSP|nr:aprataxin and PNK-like factor [Betta splendens]